MLEARG